MSATNIFRFDDGVILFNDAAMYDDNGTLCRIGGKSLVWAELPCVMAARGKSTILPMLDAFYGGCYPTFDAFLSQAEQAFRHLREVNEQAGDFEVVIGGWSESRERFETYAALSEPEGPYEAFKPIPLPAAHIAPIPTEAAFVELGLSIETLDIDTVEGVKTIMEAQRRSALPFHRGEGAEHGCCVGGVIYRTALYRDRVEMTMVHRWPDVIGERMTPGGED